MDQIKRKRDRLEVIYDILKIIRYHNNSIKPTPLLRYSNLSSQSFSEYLNELLEKGLLKEIIDEKGKKFLTLTDKGSKYLEKYKLILGFIEEFEL
ncbi:MAG: winged helix DNA-binding protein [Methanosarcinales archaeon]|uniref:Winged helix DNA-binding protein n=1 Tax=Candidatus Ethanoperedens thermophilum TaxID=2766897 RepID=A0A848D9P2_9EURY|nr:winged helix DNA-binding protein [Candidatus Ethanoperedens thermophilum]